MDASGRRARSRSGALLAALCLLAAPARAVECVAPWIEHVVSPQTTDPAIGAPTNNHFAYVTPSVPSRGELLLFFPGSCAPPIVYRWFLREAANAGYHAIGLAHPNCPEINATCNAQNPIDPDCQESMRLERLEGVDASPLVAVPPANAIVHRTAALLAWLDAQFPAEGWGAYLDGGAPRWNRIAVAGHSQGAGHAANIGRLHEVARVIMFDWTDFVPGVGAAPWMAKPRATPAERYVALYHEQTFAVAVVLGLNALGVPPATVSVPATPEPYAHANRLSTGILEQGGGDNLHGAVVVDGVTPVRADGTPVLADVWRHLLGATPSDVVPVPATKLLLKDGSAKANPSARKLQLGVSTKGEALRLLAPDAGSAGDPTLHGATLSVFNAAAGGEVATFVLPAANWTTLGAASNPRGFIYKDRASGAPIRKAVVQDDRLTVTGGKAAFCYTLDEPQQGRIGVRLGLGAGVAWCADVPAKAQGTPPSTAKHDAVDGFRGASDAPAPAACPMVPRNTTP